jgi:hypothetical protein
MWGDKGYLTHGLMKRGAGEPEFTVVDDWAFDTGTGNGEMRIVKTGCA